MKSKKALARRLESLLLDRSISSSSNVDWLFYPVAHKCTQAQPKSATSTHRSVSLQLSSKNTIITTRRSRFRYLRLFHCLHGHHLLGQSHSRPRAFIQTYKMSLSALSSRLPLLGSLIPKARFHSINTIIAARQLSTCLSFSRMAVQSRSAQAALSMATQVRGMKTRSSVKKLCEGCKVRVLSF